jgi:hypothetical protein
LLPIAFNVIANHSWSNIFLGLGMLPSPSFAYGWVIIFLFRLKYLMMVDQTMNKLNDFQCLFNNKLPKAFKPFVDILSLWIVVWCI